MFYSIKVFRNGGLIFSTDPTKTQSVFKLVETFKLIDTKFPESEGFTLDVCIYPLTFSRQAWQKILKSAEQPDINKITLILLSRL